jgi:hypothetical protein
MTKRARSIAKAEGNSALATEAPTWENASLRERASIESAEKRIGARPERVSVQVEKTPTGFRTKAAKGGVEASLPLQLADAMGTTSSSFTDYTLSNIATFIASCNNRGVNATDLNAALAVLDGMKPENEVEAMLLAQMWATNESAMRALGMIGNSDWTDNVAMFGNLATKLLRTYVSQVEALAKLRRRGEQTVKVVHVYPGGQAVVTDTFNTGGRLETENDERSHAPHVAAATCPEMLGKDPQGVALPIPGHEREETVSYARRDKHRRAKGQ